MKKDVFLSYSFKDAYRIRRLRVALTYFGLDSWPDERHLPGTPAWQAQMAERMSQSCCLLLALSQDTTLSAWVTQALEQAAIEGVPVVPVVVDGNPGHILLLELETDAWFDLRWSRNYRTEMQAIVRLIRSYQGETVPDVIIEDF